ncbi:hypothetical protein [Bartonella sp. AP7XZML]|uniref:hypothetical protein n=1 Tax=Bartonella sp. AP7XZML TaxID=3243503 RepID=UPI0035CF1CF9
MDTALFEGLAVSVEGKDALFLRARVHPLMDWILLYLRVWQFPLRGRMHSFEGGVHLFHGLDTAFIEGSAVSVEGKDALFLRRGVHPLMDWILPYEGLAVSVEGKDALF